MPIDGTAPIRTFAYTYTPGEGFGGTWAPDGRAFEDLVYRDGATNLWRFPARRLPTEGGDGVHVGSDH